MKVVDKRIRPTLLSKFDMDVGEVFAGNKTAFHWMLCKSLGGLYVLNLEEGSLCPYAEFNSEAVYYKVSGAFVVDGDSNDS